jgi:hypothetical protein
MRLRFLSIAQFSLIVALSCTAAYSFLRSFAYPYVEDAVSDIPGSLGMRVILLLATIGIEALVVVKKNWPAGAIWLVVLLCLAEVTPLWLTLGAVSTLLGIILVIRRGQVWGFLGLLGVLYFPSLMAFSSADWLWFRRDFTWETDLTFAPMAALGGWLIVGYLALRYATQFKESGMNLIDQGHEPTDVKKWYVNKVIFASIILLGAVLTTAIIIGSSIGLDHLLGEYVANIPFRAVLLGIGGSAILIAAIYSILVGRKSASA